MGDYALEADGRHAAKLERAAAFNDMLEAEDALEDLRIADAKRKNSQQLRQARANKRQHRLYRWLTQ